MPRVATNPWATAIRGPPRILLRAANHLPTNTAPNIFPLQGYLLWIDIDPGFLHVFNPRTGRDRRIELGQQVGTVVPCRADRGGGALVALADGLYHVDLVTEELTPLLPDAAQPERSLATNRFNDGKCDPAGRLWAGTMNVDCEGTAGALYCVAAGHCGGDVSYSVTTKLPAGTVGISNGIVWVGDTMYYIDTPRRTVDAFPYDAATGAIDAGARKAVITFPSKSEDPSFGHPDGMAADAAGTLWVACWGGAQVTRWDPATGALLLRVPIPNAVNVTSVAFGGAGLDELYVTTARRGTDFGGIDGGLNQDAGGLFRVTFPAAMGADKPVGVAATPFAGGRPVRPAAGAVPAAPPAGSPAAALYEAAMAGGSAGGGGGDNGAAAVAAAAAAACRAQRSVEAHKGRVVIVTGGAGGIGLGICEGFAAAGAKVVCCDINEAAGAAFEAKYPGGDAYFVRADMAKEEDCKRVVDACVARFGRVDALVNNVGIQPPSSNVPVHELSTATWDALQSINLKSYYLMSRFVLPLMLARPDHDFQRHGTSPHGGQRGAIVNIASVQGLQSQPGVPAYAASKGGILAMTRNMALDYAPHRIRVNAVCPGTVQTPLVTAALDAAGKTYADVRHTNKATGAFTLIEGGVGQPEHIAEAVLFLVSERAAYITGEHLSVDGGIMAKGGWTT